MKNRRFFGDSVTRLNRIEIRFLHLPLEGTQVPPVCLCVRHSLRCTDVAETPFPPSLPPSPHTPPTPSASVSFLSLVKVKWDVTQRPCGL